MPDDVKFNLVRLDGDIYHSTLDGIDYFWLRLVTDARTFDHYGWRNCPGVKQAIDEMLSSVVLEVGVNQAWIRNAH